MASTTLASRCDVSSSDSSDEDEKRRFMEAAVLDCHHSTKLKKEPDTKSLLATDPVRPRQNIGGVSKPSQRPSKQESHEAENELNTTPEFRAFVSKKLSQIVEGMIKVSDKKAHDKQCNGTLASISGVRLFKSSSKLVSLDTRETPKHVKKRPVESSSSDSSEDERLASAAVSHDFIFKDSKVEMVPSTETQESNLSENVKKKKKKHKRESENGELAEKDNDSSTLNGHSRTPKCKKKKKKKERSVDE